MEWMDSAMVTRLLSLSHIGAFTDVSVSGRDTRQLADICLHQHQSCASNRGVVNVCGRWSNIVKFHEAGFENGGDRCIMDEGIRMRVHRFWSCLRHHVSGEYHSRRVHRRSSENLGVYVTLEIHSDLVANWKREWYDHLHLGGIGLILTLHSRKGLPVTDRIALLDTRFKQYQHAIIGTVLTTLHASSVLLTFYPNFNLSLEDPNLPTTIKVQIQLQGADQTPTSKLATLHHQIVYRLANHALDLRTPYTTSDALMILANTDTIPTIIQIPKQIQKQELLKLMPLEWLTNYEHFHQNSKPVQTTEATFEIRQNSQVKLSFQTLESQPVPDTPRLSYTTMITAVQIGQEKKLPIHGFSFEGYPVYPDKINGHFLWDVPEAHMCNPDFPYLDDTDIEDEHKVMRRKKKKKKKPSHSKTSCKSFPPLSPPDPKPPVQPIRSCLMFSGQSYEESFPPLEKQTDTQTRVVSKPFVQSPVIASGQPEEPKHHRLDQMYIHLQDRISELDTDLRRMINNHIWGPEFHKKEAEIRKLKAELARINAEKARPTLFTQTQSTPVPPPVFETYSPFYTPPRPHQPVYNQFFGFSHLQPTPQPKPSSPKKSKSKVKISEPKTKPTSSSSTPSVPPEDSPQATPDPPKIDKGPIDQYHYQIVHDSSSETSEPETVCESTPSESHSSSSSTNSTSTSTDSESEYADITSILMATKTEDPSASTSTPIVEDSSSNDEHKASHTKPVPPMPPPAHDHSTKPSSVSWFTFDDIPRHRWPTRLQEFAAWIDLQGTKPNAQSQAVFREFMARSTGSLRDSLESLGEYRQLQFMQSLVATNLSIADISLGKIFQMAMLCLDKIREQKEFFKDLMADTKPFSEACKKPNLKMECKDEKNSGVRYKQMFLPYTDILRLYALSETPSPYSHLSPKFLEFCPENHSQFPHPSPLWKNEQFFIHLPFKLIEDINPTKASHPGMSQLLQQGLIEPTNSDWACQAFYVEKRSELVRGKKRLIIDYQPLNSFLKDDKFPLPKIQTLFVHLQGARIFSKFDLKAGFWQLGISPVDRHKTAFCIPDAIINGPFCPLVLKLLLHYFKRPRQKFLVLSSTMLWSTLMIFCVFSSDHENHQKLLLDFFYIVQAYGIMLYEKKSSIGKESIDFLGMVIKDGHYQPGPHIATELLKFPDTNFTKKKIQQYLGIVNYVRDFIPKVAVHKSQLSRMLKKQCPPWGPT
ncbi:hypothetical protein KPL71_004216 [Citrus sinensis]|uniref:Uncharacterized protein n=1 Tax=Citrus sinensis TaxID=2711 RepID=A0ACB8N439_CITSI|nr:hypothetical protein KPL71_004216 [Citrus sinensis]